MGLDWAVKRPKQQRRARTAGAGSGSGDAAPHRYPTRFQARKTAGSEGDDKKKTDAADDKKGGDKKDAAKEEEEDEEDEDDDYLAHERIGSYSGVHELRKRCVEAAVRYLEALPPASPLAGDCNAALPVLRSWVADDSRATQLRMLMGNPLMRALLADGMPIDSLRNPVNYPAVHGSGGALDRLRRLGLLGLWHFVNHSDCDGQHTAGEAADILTAHRLIEPHFDQESREWFAGGPLPVLRVAVQHQLPILYT